MLLDMHPVGCQAHRRLRSGPNTRTPRGRAASDVPPLGAAQPCRLPDVVAQALAAPCKQYAKIKCSVLWVELMHLLGYRVETIIGPQMPPFASDGTPEVLVRLRWGSDPRQPQGKRTPGRG